MLRPSRTVYQDVVKEHKYKATQVRAKNLIHECLEREGRIGEAKRHHQELEVTVVHPECCLVDVISVHAHLVIAVAKVELGEESGAP